MHKGECLKKTLENNFFKTTKPCSKWQTSSQMYDEVQSKSCGGKGDFAYQKTKKTPTNWSQGSAKDFAIDQDGTKWMEVGWTS